ncbi:MAG: hypothetical protein VW625_02405 [Perlucidibaca sp.]
MDAPAVTKLFAFQASQDLREAVESVLRAYGGKTLPTAPQAPVIVDFAQRYSDEIVDALILNLVKGADADSAAPKALETVANLIKSTVHALIRQVLGKLNNEELKPVAAYIAAHRTEITRDGVTRDYINFQLSDADYELLRGAWSRTAAGQGDKQDMTKATLRFSELAIEAFYEDAAKAIKLGFIARNMFNMGHVAISKGSRTAISRLIPSLRPKELQEFASYFNGMLKVV